MPQFLIVFGKKNKKLYEAIKYCKRKIVEAPLNKGDIIIKNVAGTDANIISSISVAKTHDY